MIISKDVYDLMDVVADEVRYCHDSGKDAELYPMRWSYDDRTRRWYDMPHVLRNGLPLGDVLDAYDATVSSGCNYCAITTPTVTFKWLIFKDDNMHATSSDAEVNFYNRHRDTVVKNNLATTVRYRDFVVQETLRPAADYIPRHMSNRARMDLYVELLEALAQVPLVDVHIGNWGFRGRDRKTPVIFDFSSRQRGRRYLSDLNLQLAWKGSLTSNTVENYRWELDEYWEELMDFWYPEHT